jgi:hypothetical protein
LIPIGATRIKTPNRMHASAIKGVESSENASFRLLLSIKSSSLVDHANYSPVLRDPTSQLQQWERHLAAICEDFKKEWHIF